jgi:hypothetical protein
MLLLIDDKDNDNDDDSPGLSTPITTATTSSYSKRCRRYHWAPDLLGQIYLDNLLIILELSLLLLFYQTEQKAKRRSKVKTDPLLRRRLRLRKKKTTTTSSPLRTCYIAAFAPQGSHYFIKALAIMLIWF